MRVIQAILFLLLGALASSLWAAPRQWSDASGNFKLEAEFAGTSGDAVLLKTTGGKVISVPLSKLSKKDQDWVQGHRQHLSDARQSTQQRAPTFNRDIALVVFAKCMSCHREGEVAPFPLTNYDEVQRRARQIALVTKQRIMPPWKPAPGHGEFEDDRSLTEEQIALFQAWLDAGKPEGDPADLPPAPKFHSGWRFGQPDMVLKLATPFPVPAEGKDIYVHFVFPMNLPENNTSGRCRCFPATRGWRITASSCWMEAAPRGNLLRKMAASEAITTWISIRDLCRGDFCRVLPQDWRHARLTRTTSTAWVSRWAKG